MKRRIKKDGDAQGRQETEMERTGSKTKTKKGGQRNTNNVRTR